VKVSCKSDEIADVIAIFMMLLQVAAQGVSERIFVETGSLLDIIEGFGGSW
jgi:hypothetical protein